jgi:hypothetical protein
MKGYLTMRALLLMALVGAGCQTRSYELTTGASTNDGGDGPGRIDGPVLDGGTALDRGADRGGGTGGSGGDGAAPDACSAAIESDPANCGACGNICSVAHAIPTCAAGKCGRGDCLPGYLDLNGMAEDGCEYGCTVTQAGTEVCDGVDNDCDGTPDDGFDKLTDLDNCGACGHPCAFLNAGASCTAGQCVLGACAVGFRDANNRPDDGCECGQSNGGVEICDGFDNDCNGSVDDIPLANLQDDPQHCGACARNCTALPHAAASCSMGACTLLGCAFGWTDRDGMADTGCEQACPGGFVGAPEVCDGIDNDCDGLLDAADDGLVGVTNFCLQRGECSGSQPVCVAAAWVCSYGTTVETTAPNQIIGNETRCDGKDNDCDGCIDESFPQVGLQPASAGGSCSPTPPQACTDAGIGTCQGRGHYACNPAGNGIACTITAVGAAPSGEICDGLDNNCDGTVDNSGPTDPARIRDPMVAVSGGGLPAPVYVYAYEASRPDATAAGAGSSSTRACANSGVRPWTNLTYAQAAAACQAAGKRLCTEAEWQRACQSAAAVACTWSQAGACSDPAAVACNIHEHDGDSSAAGDQDVLLPTGGLPGCYAPWGTEKIFDLTGNAKEFTSARSPGVNPLRGGSYDNISSGTTCTFSFTAVGDGFAFGNTGFRCCSDTPP